MKKVCLDMAENNGCTAVYVKDAEVIPAGTTVSAMSVKHKTCEYQRFADEYDIHFIFGDNIPQVDFYTVPQFDIMATDSDGGYIGTVGQHTDLGSSAPICYIDKNKKCYLIAADGKSFLKNVSHWKSSLKPCDGVRFYNCRETAEKEMTFIDIPPNRR